MNHALSILAEVDAKVFVMVKIKDTVNAIFSRAFLLNIIIELVKNPETDSFLSKPSSN